MKTKEELIRFSEEIASIYENGKIKSPIHLSGGDEEQLISIFKEYKEGDWIFGTWRSHHLWLLSGKSEEELKKQILEGRSMHIYGERFFTSSIVGGITPIALGVAYALKLKKSENKVWCFLGDMGASGGLASESFRFARGHELPITFIIQDNGLSVRAETKKTWGLGKEVDIRVYKYERKYNHAGCGLNGQKRYVMF